MNSPVLSAQLNVPVEIDFSPQVKAMLLLAIVIVALAVFRK